MKKFKFTIVALFATALVFTACKKEDEGDTEAPVVTVTLHEAGPFMNGDTVHVHVNATDNDVLHGVVTTITREHDGAEVFHSHDHTSEATFSSEFMYVTDNGGNHSDFTVSAVAEDESENSKEATATFHVHM